MKKILCILLAVLQVVLFLSACSGEFPWLNNQSYTWKSVAPTYDDDKELAIIAFWSPPNTVEWYQSMVDCGFTDVIIDAKYDLWPDTEKLFEGLSICDEVGIGAYVAINREKEFSADPRYAQYESFKGINTDEPLTKAQLDIVLDNIEKMGAAYTDKDVRCWMGLAYGVKGEFNTPDDFLEYYMDNGGQDQGVFSICCYPLVGTGVKGEIGAGWLKSLEDVATYAKRYDVDLYTYISTMSISSITCRKPAEDDLRYTAYVSLAYGAKGIGEFCYMSPGLPPYDSEFKPNDYALVNFTDPSDFSTYYKTPTWEYAKNVNFEIKAFDHVLMNYDWKGTMKSEGSDAQTSAGANCFPNVERWIEKHDGIESFTSTEDAIMGVLKDDNGYEGLMLVNFADPLYNRENTVTLTFNGATRAIVYIKGQPQTVELVDGTYTVTLEPGEGQFIIPLS